MAVTPSNMLALGSKATDFTLVEPLTQTMRSLSSLKSRTATVIIFMCNHCPFVKYIIDKLVDVENQYQEKGIQFIAINSNDVEHYPGDSPEKMIEFIHEKNISFPYLFDETQTVAKAYDAACTPDFFVYNKDLALIYRGRFDEATPGNHIKPTGEALSQALDAVLAGKPVNTEQKPSVGCNIKWR